MLGRVRQPVIVPPRGAGVGVSPARFGGGAETAAKEIAQAGTAQIKHLGIAEKIFRHFGRLSAGERPGGLSLEDIAARTLTVFGVYLPQGVLAIKEDKHKWETNGRNIVVWTMTLGLTWLLKNEKWGLNSLLDKFMKPRVPDEQLKNGLDKLINPLRLKVDYFDILEKAGIDYKDADRKVAFWSKLDANKLKEVNYLYDDLKLKMRNGTLEKGEKEILEALPGFIKRLNIFPMIATSLITAATVYLIGDVAMRIVYKFIAPFDHDFDPNSVHKKGKNKGAASSSAQTGGTQAMPHPLSITQPRLFRSFSRPAAGAAPLFGQQVKPGQEGQRHV